MRHVVAGSAFLVLVTSVIVGGSAICEAGLCRQENVCVACPPGTEVVDEDEAEAQAVPQNNVPVTTTNETIVSVNKTEVIHNNVTAAPTDETIVSMNKTELRCHMQLDGAQTVSEIITTTIIRSFTSILTSHCQTANCCSGTSDQFQSVLLVLKDVQPFVPNIFVLQIDMQVSCMETEPPGSGHTQTGLDISGAADILNQHANQGIVATDLNACCQGNSNCCGATVRWVQVALVVDPVGLTTDSSTDDTTTETTNTEEKELRCHLQLEGAQTVSQIVTTTIITSFTSILTSHCQSAPCCTGTGEQFKSVLLVLKDVQPLMTKIFILHIEIEVTCMLPEPPLPCRSKSSSSETGSNASSSKEETGSNASSSKEVNIT